LERGGSSVVGRGRSEPDRPPRSNGKLEAATAVCKLLMMGMTDKTMEEEIKERIA
jgi:hypothetical protein